MSLMIVMGAVAVIVVSMSEQGQAGPAPKQLEGFTMEEVLSGNYYADTFNGTWISGLYFLSGLVDLYIHFRFPVSGSPALNV